MPRYDIRPIAQRKIATDFTCDGQETANSNSSSKRRWDRPVLARNWACSHTTRDVVNLQAAALVDDLHGPMCFYRSFVSLSHRFDVPVGNSGCEQRCKQWACRRGMLEQRFYVRINRPGRFQHRLPGRGI